MNKKLLIKQNKQHRRFVFIALVVFSAFFGIFDVLFYIKPEIWLYFYIANFAITIYLILLWLKFDNVIHNRRLRFSQGLAVAFVGLIAIPIYFWNTRTPKQFFVSLGGLHLYLIPLIIQYFMSFSTQAILQIL